MLPQPAQANMNYQQWNPYMQYQGKFSRFSSIVETFTLYMTSVKSWAYINYISGGLTRSPSMSSIMSGAQPDNPSELAVAMQKMEHCMALLNSLQCQNPNMVLPNMQSLMGPNMGGPMGSKIGAPMANMGQINRTPSRNMGPMPGHVPIIRRPSHNLGAPLSQIQR